MALVDLARNLIRYALGIKFCVHVVVFIVERATTPFAHHSSRTTDLSTPKATGHPLSVNGMKIALSTEVVIDDPKHEKREYRSTEEYVPILCAIKSKISVARTELRSYRISPSLVYPFDHLSTETQRLRCLEDLLLRAPQRGSLLHQIAQHRPPLRNILIQTRLGLLQERMFSEREILPRIRTGASVGCIRQGEWRLHQRTGRRVRSLTSRSPCS